MFTSRKKLSIRHLTVAILFAIIVPTAGAVGAAATGFELHDYRGKVVVLDFWASWCVPCRHSFPWMNAMQEKYGDQGLVIIAVNMDAAVEERDRFLSAHPAGFSIVNDPEGELARTYGVIAMPSSYVFDRNGNQVARHLGFRVREQDEYEATLIEALAR